MIDASPENFPKVSKRGVSRLGGGKFGEGTSTQHMVTENGPLSQCSRSGDERPLQEGISFEEVNTVIQSKFEGCYSNEINDYFVFSVYESL